MPKISQLTELTTLQTGSIIPVVDGLVTKKVTMGTLVTFLNVETGVIPSGTVSSSTQLNSLGAVTTSSFNSYTSSLATTGSNTFIGNQTITGSLNVSSSVNLSGSIVINGLTYPTFGFTDGQYGVEVPTLGVNNVFTMEVPKTIYEYVKNDSGTTLYKGTPVHSTGTVGFNTLVIAASASVASTMPATYILAQDLDDGEEGLGIAIGAIQGVNTTGLIAGDAVYVGANGGWTQTKPTGSNLIQNLGIVTKVGVNGGGVILGAGRANDVPNIQQGYFWVGNSGSVATAIPTSSFATTGSNRFNGNQIITGSVDLTGFPLTASFIRLNGGNGSLNEDNFHQIRFDYRYDSGSRDLGAGGFSHFLTSRHFPGANSNNNALDVYLNNSVGQYTSTAWNTGSTLGVTITATGIGVLKTNPNTALDVSGNLLVTGSIISTTSPIISSSTQITNFGFAITGSNTFVGNQTVSGNLIIANNNNLILKGPGDDGFSGSGDIIWQDANGGEMARLWKSADAHRLVVSFTGSQSSYIFGTLIHSINLKEFGDLYYVSNSSFDNYTSSNDTKVNSLVNKTGSLATTGSNTFVGNQIITGSVYVTGSNSTIVLPNNSTAPTSPASGALYFNTTDFHFYGWDGGQWKQLDN